MSKSFTIHADPPRLQRASDQSYIGGVPCLPTGWPLQRCRLCRAPLTFFLQLRMPPDHPWRDRIVSLFACTHCVDADHLAPPLPDGPLKGAMLEEDFLERCQANFRVLVFRHDQAARRGDYRERLDFRPLRFEPAIAESAEQSHLGGGPVWLAGDEGPRGCTGRGGMVFLFQLGRELPYKPLPMAPPQPLLSFSEDPEWLRDRYSLFLDRAVYVYGVRTPLPGARVNAYLLTQLWEDAD